MNGLRFMWDSEVDNVEDVSSPEINTLQVSGGKWLLSRGKHKTSNRSPCPVPLVVKHNVKCQGSVETDDYGAEIWFRANRWIQRHTAEGHKFTLVQNYKSTLLCGACGINTTEPKWCCKHWNGASCRSEQEVHVQEENDQTKRQRDERNKKKKKNANALLFIFLQMIPLTIGHWMLKGIDYHRYLHLNFVWLHIPVVFCRINASHKYFFSNVKQTCTHTAQPSTL